MIRIRLLHSVHAKGSTSLCCAGGPTTATVITLPRVPVLYAICVYDLRLVSWETPAGHS